MFPTNVQQAQSLLDNALLLPFEDTTPPADSGANSSTGLSGSMASGGGLIVSSSSSSEFVLDTSNVTFSSSSFSGTVGTIASGGGSSPWLNPPPVFEIYLSAAVSQQDLIGYAQGGAQITAFIDPQAFGCGTWLRETDGKYTLLTPQGGYRLLDSVPPGEAIRIYGSSASELFLSSFSHPDRISAGAGNDTLRGSTGDSLYGGSGNDLIFSAGAALIDGGSGVDTLNSAVDLSDSSAGFSVTDDGKSTQSDGSLLVKNIEIYSELSLGAGNDVVTFARRADSVIKTGAGDDTIAPGFGHDTVDGGSGTDVLVLDYSRYGAVAHPTTTLNGISFFDNQMQGGTLTGLPLSGGVADHLTFSGIDAEQIIATGRNDSIQTGRGTDYIDAGAGNDFIQSGVSVGPAPDYYVDPDTGSRVYYGTVASNRDTVIGGAGFDTLDSADLSRASQNLVLTDSGRTLAALALHSGPSISGVEYIRNVETGRGNDRINYLGRDNNILYAGAGNDTVNPGLGQDYVDGGSGRDLLMLDYSGLTFAGTKQVTPGVALLTRADGHGAAFAYRDTVSASDALTFDHIEQIRVKGSRFADVLQTGSGADTLDGGAGADSLVGGAGNDVYVVDSSHDTIRETANGGTDLVRASLNYTLGANLENLTLTGSAKNALGNAANNILTGNSQANSLIGGGGNDALFGAAGNDFLGGSSGNDTLTGAAGSGLGERDTLLGGSGSDLFVLGTSAGALYDDGLAAKPGTSDYALIQDFTPGEDRLQLAGQASDYHLGASGLSGVKGLGLFHESGPTDELIAVLQSPKSLTAANTLATAAFV